MKGSVLVMALAIAAILGVAPGAQSDVVQRRATRDRLRTSLTAYGPTVNMSFHQNEKVEWNFSAMLTQGLKNADSFEVVLGVTDNQTISLNAYPRVNGAYVNLEKVRNPGLLTRRMANLTYHNFLAWGADDSGDVLARFQFTLESGFPLEAIQVVLRSIKNLDEFVGQMRPDIDGSSAR